MADDPNKGESGQDTGGAEKRINQLTRQRHDATRRADTAETRNQALTDQLVNLQGTVEQLSTRLASVSQPAQPDPLAALLGTESKQSKTATPSQPGVPIDFEGMIGNAVQKALAPMVQAQQDQAVQQELLGMQKQSFEDAAVFVPDIKVDGSPAQDLFDKIWQGNPELQLSPNGPGIVVNAVAGLLGTEVRTSKVQEARKQAASSPTVMNPLARIGDLPSGKVTADDAVKSLAQEGATKGLNLDGLAALIGLRTGRAHITEE